MKKTFQLLTLILMLAMPWYAAGQTRSVSVRVNDATGPLAGAGVLVKGTTMGTVTDIDGNCSIPGVEASTVLVSFQGFLQVRKIRLAH